MHIGLHAENGLDLLTSISLLRTCIFFNLNAWARILIPNGKDMDCLDKQYIDKKIVKQDLS